MASSTYQRAAAMRLESSDDVLTKVLAPLPLEARCRLSTVSRRWQRILLEELRFPHWVVWRAPAVLRRAVSAIHVLDVSSVVRAADSASCLKGVLRALRGAGGELRTLITWDCAAGSLTADRLAKLALFSEEEALELRGSCPRLDATTRLAVGASDAVQVIALLDVLPGRHAIQLDLPVSEQEEEELDGAGLEVLKKLFRHPRLCALNLVYASDQPSEWLAAALPAIVDALGTGQGCALEHLRILDGREGLGLELAPAFLDEGAVAATFGAAAGAPFPPCSLRSFSVQHWTEPSFVRGVLAASRGSLQHLSFDSNHRLVEDDHPATLAAVLGHIGASLEMLCLGDEQLDGALLPGLAPLLASPGCRLRALFIDGLGAVEGLAPGELPLNPFHGFLHALSLNRSLRAVSLGVHSLNPEQTVLLGAALCAPLVNLDVGMGTNDAGPAGIVALLATTHARTLSLRRHGTDDRDVKALAASLTLNESIQSVDLYHFERGSPVNTDCSAVLQALVNNSTLQNLVWRRHGPQDSLKCTLEALGSLLLKNTTLRVLSLGGMGVEGSAEGIVAVVAEALAQNRTIRVFSIGRVCGDACARFIRALRGNKTLRVLCFENTAQSEEESALLGVELAASCSSLRLRDLAFKYPRSTAGSANFTSAGLLVLVATALRAVPGLSLHLGLAGSIERATWLEAAAGLPMRLQERVRVASAHVDEDAWWSLLMDEFYHSVFPLSAGALLAEVSSTAGTTTSPSQ